MKTMYIFLVEFFDVKSQKELSRLLLKNCDASQIRFVAHESLVFFKTLPGVRDVRLKVFEVTGLDEIPV